MANLTQKLTYAQTWEVTFPGGTSVPVTSPPTSYPGNTVDVSNSYTTEVTGEELTKTAVVCTGPVDNLVLCDVETATQCFAYLEANANNTDGVTIAYVDEAGTSTDIALLYAGQSIFIPFLVSITPSSGDNCKLTGTALSGSQEVYVSASHNG